VACRFALAALLAAAVAQIGATPASGDAELRAPVYYLGRADARLCPSPVCGGIWLRAVNRAPSNCRRPLGQQCYVARLEFADEVGDRARQRLTALVAGGRGLVLGFVTRGTVEGFPDLHVLRVVRAWRASSGSRQPRGVFRRLRDNGVRCVTTPCFSTRASALNVGSGIDVSGVELSATGAGAAERRWAQTLVATRELLAAGVVRRAHNEGRIFVASQIYFPAGLR
jgi:hypothetical protein